MNRRDQMTLEERIKMSIEMWRQFANPPKPPTREQRRAERARWSWKRAVEKFRRRQS